MRAIAILLLLNIGCAGVPDPESWHAAFNLDASISNENGEVIKAAVGDWTLASHGEITSSVCRDCDGINIKIVSREEIQARCGGEPVGCYTGVEVLLSDWGGNEGFHATVLHELGHTFGIAEHSLDSRDIMFRDNLKQPGLTQNDKERLLAVVGE